MVFGRADPTSLPPPASSVLAAVIPHCCPSPLLTAPRCRQRRRPYFTTHRRLGIMADRIPQYPMFSQNLMQNSLQQSQISQQPQAPDSQMIQGLPNLEHTRTWQLQNQYRAQQSGDITASQMNQQASQWNAPVLDPLDAELVAFVLSTRSIFSYLTSYATLYRAPHIYCFSGEFPRGQTLSHGQVQGQQPTVQQIQPSFALNAQRMNAPGPAFHDPQSNQAQSLIPPNFTNVPMDTQQQAKAGFNRNAIMQPPMNHPGVSRQFQRMVAQSQQNQQAPNVMDLARLQQAGLSSQHGANHPAAADMFASSSMPSNQDQMHGSPHPAAQPTGPSTGNQGMFGNPQVQNGQKRPFTLGEIHERRNFLFGLTQQTENQIMTLLQATRGAPEHLVQSKLSQLGAELTNRKEAYSKFMAAVSQQMSNNMLPTNIPHLNPMIASPSQPQQAAVASVQAQPGFVPSASQPSAQQFGMTPTANGSSPMHSQNQTPPNQQIPVQSGQIGRPNGIPPRSGATPHQMPGGQLSNTMSPNLGNQLAMQTPIGQMAANQMRQSSRVLPLDKLRFEATYEQFCRSQQITPNARVALPDNRKVDLHQLHVYVMQEGGSQSVTLRDMWSVIGGRMGFIQSLGNNSEPPRSGPGIAQHLQHTYKEYLQRFENAYVLTVKSRAPNSPRPQIQQMNPMISNSGAKPGMLPGNPAEMPSSASRASLTQQTVNIAARYAHASVSDMRNEGVPEHIISIVDRHRPELAKYQQQQQQQQAQLIAKRNAEQEQQNMANAQGQFFNMHEQMPMGPEPGVQRPQQTMLPNTMSSMPASEQKPMNTPVAQGIPSLHKHPSQDQLQHAITAIITLKQMFQQRSLTAMPTQQLPDEQRQEYNQLLEQVHKMTLDLDSKLHMHFAIFKNEELLRKYVAIVMTVARQRQLVSTSSPQYIITLMTLRSMQTQIQKVNEDFENRWRAIRMAAAAHAQQHAGPIPPVTRPIPGAPLPISPAQNMPQTSSPSVPSINGRQAPINPPPAQQSHLQPHSLSQLQSHAQPPPQSHHHHQPQHHSQSQSQPVKKPVPPSPSVPPAHLASPTPPPPVASASTPVSSAATPQTTAGSPQTPKSPKSKAATKTRAAPRPSRKPSTTGKGPAMPETAPPSVAGVKRPPEDDVAALTNAAPSETDANNAPSPKKVKTEWDGEPSEALVKKQQEIENIKTDDDATAFLDRVKELFAMTASADNEIHSDIASTLDQILAGVAQEPTDAAATAAAFSAYGSADGLPPSALSPHMGPANDAFLEFIDFSSFTTLEDEDNDSKAPTPDLVPSSETNPSPESGSEGDSLGSLPSPDKTKTDEPGDYSDPLRLRSLREVDGGESAYYQADNWKWEGSMPTPDQPWAMFTSS
ncbi:hypothetical protein PAXRUDRAFT_11085 [Paxillus rubicundulus Ve08.2h10]|uniref:ARID domain-containing protein n=1 Tax=Paxillus rubicundulus Ve08.2h10 TaxID=930991 RepID=A0A0D0DS18_9AGAM|nr:hypothetical protein PAXRUDRAFT_11085 [Paxillus rubicundulus Ve08.2h10]